MLNLFVQVQTALKKTLQLLVLAARPLTQSNQGAIVFTHGIDVFRPGFG